MTLDNLDPFSPDRTLLMRLVEYPDTCWYLMDQAKKRWDESPWQLMDLYCARRLRLPSREEQLAFDDEVSEQYTIAPGTMRNWRTLFADFPGDRRRQGLRLSHHMAVLPLPPDDQDLLLDLAESQSWPVSRLEQAVAEAKHPPTVEQVDQSNQLSNLFLSSGIRITMQPNRASFQVNGNRITVTSKSSLEWSVE
jgi:hypothetical protein